MVIDLEYLGRDSRMVMFVVLRPDLTLDAALQARIHGAIQQTLSPRFVPDVTLQASEIPRTLSGKKLEVPVKKLLRGTPLEKAANVASVDDPEALLWYQRFAAERLGRDG